MEKKNQKIGAVMVIGGGIAGIQASLDLAESGLKVFLLENAPAIGGNMPVFLPCRSECPWFCRSFVSGEIR